MLKTDSVPVLIYVTVRKQNTRLLTNQIRAITMSFPYLVSSVVRGNVEAVVVTVFFRKKKMFR